MMASSLSGALPNRKLYLFRDEHKEKNYRSVSNGRCPSLDS